MVASLLLPQAGRGWVMHYCNSMITYRDVTPRGQKRWKSIRHLRAASNEGRGVGEEQV